MLDLVWLIPLLALAGAAVNLFLGRRLGKTAGWLATALVGLGFVLAVATLVDLLGLPADQRAHVTDLFDWISVGTFNVDVALRVDPLSITMMLVVTGVGSLIHLYAIGYMEHDPRFGTFFAYLNLFVFFMLMLVLADNYLLLYLGWEGVGLCSYLLIGFWYERPSASSAAKKAFITTRIGDAAMLLGIVLIFLHVGSLDFGVVFGPGASELTKGTATAISLLLLAGAIGKSAQLPLHVWLPDAMEGPTPVSALIHAATMVTAGVYLVVRSHVLFELSGTALTVVLVVGLVLGAVRGARVDRPVRPQARARVLDDEPDRVHVLRGRDAVLHRGDAAARLPRVLQGPALPHGRQRPARPARRDRHAADGRPAGGDAALGHLVRDRRVVAGRHPAARGLLREGSDRRVRRDERTGSSRGCSRRSARSCRPCTSRGRCS